MEVGHLKDNEIIIGDLACELIQTQKASVAHTYFLDLQVSCLLHIVNIDIIVTADNAVNKSMVVLYDVSGLILHCKNKCIKQPIFRL